MRYSFLLGHSTGARLVGGSVPSIMSDSFFEPAVVFASLVPIMLSEGDRQMVGKIPYFLVHDSFGGGCLAGVGLLRSLCPPAVPFGGSNLRLARQRTCSGGR